MKESNDGSVTVLMIGALPLWADSGASIHLREVAKRLHEFGIRPVVLCLLGLESGSNSNIQEVRVRVWRRRFALQISWNCLATVRALRLIRTARIDVIYSRLDPGMIVGWLAAKMTGRPLIVELNGLPTEDVRLYRPNSVTLLKLTRWWEELMYRGARMVVGAPGYIRYVQNRFGVPERKCCIVQLGVDEKLFRPLDRESCRRELGLTDGRLVVWVGTIVGWQGLETLLAAWEQLVSQCPDARLLLVGDGEDRSKCEQMIRDRGISKAATLVGRVPYRTVPVYIGAADVCVASFPGDRGSPGTISALKTVNYLACGRPVVTTSMDELGEAIEHGGGGYCVPPDDPSAMAGRLNVLLSETPTASAARSANALALVGTQRTWHTTAARIAECVKSVAV